MAIYCQLKLSALLLGDYLTSRPSVCLWRPLHTNL